MSDPSQTDVVVHGRANGFSQEITAGTHHLTADEPVAAGGSDWGPSPYSLLLAGLGACTSMTCGMYARKKSWPLESVTVRLRHGRIHAKDCEDCDSKDTRLERIEREIEFAGELTPEQKARLLEIADKCPVHRTLSAGIKIQTRLI